MNAHGPVTMDQLVGAAMADRLETALWVFDFEALRIVWANRAALRLWAADSVAALAARDMGAEMSASVRKRLVQHAEDFALEPDREIREVWTLYPDGAPFRVRAVLRAFRLGCGRLAMLVEASAQDAAEPEAVRSVDALLHTQVMTALFDIKGRALYANPAHRAAFGPGAHDFAAGFSDALEAARYSARLGEDREHRATVQVETIAGPRWHDMHAVLSRDAVSGHAAFVVSAVDVTEARAQEQAMKAARDAAETADRAKSVFLATMSHELRTPLNGVLGLSSILASGRIDPDQKRMLAAISACGERMLELIENMLDMVALDAGTITVRRAPFDPALILRATAEGVRAEAEAKGLALNVDASGLGSGPFAHDAPLLRKVMRQLASNAVKFTEAGSVTLRARSTPDGALRFEVADTGPGLPEDAQRTVFERFRQRDGSSTRRHGGVGLGLAICAAMTALWRGDIGVRSVEGAGATFWFTAPQAASGAPRPAPGPCESPLPF